MQVLITGGTGFIGAELARQLIGAGHGVLLPCRNPARAQARLFGGGEKPATVDLASWDGRDAQALAGLMRGAGAVVNLLGENIVARRWSADQMRRIRDSRVVAGRAVVDAFRAADERPGVLVQASATGFYGDRGDEILDEAAAPGKGFLAETCLAWEASTKEVEDLGVRRAVVRTGVVLGRGGALEKMIAPFRFFLGGPLGSGKQWMSWIHLADEVAAIKWLVERPEAAGVYNLTAPNPLTNKEFCRALGKALRRPCLMPAPGFALKLALGRMAEELLLFGQRVLPARLTSQGFGFAFARADQALQDILG